MAARFIVLWSRPTDIEAFDEHYWNVHIPLANRMTRLRTYTVSRNVALVRGDEPFYIIGELEWTTLDHLRDDFSSPEGQATARDVAVLSQWSSGVRSMTYEVTETRAPEAQ